MVPELNLGQMAREVEATVCGRLPLRRINRVDGTAIEPGEIEDALKQVAKDV